MHPRAAAGAAHPRTITVPVVRRNRLPLLAGVLALALALAAGAAPMAEAAPKPPVDGGTSSGDPYFPRMGDSGYDALHYDIALRYRPSTRRFAAVTTVRVRPKVALRSLAFDLRGLTVSAVSVDGTRARFSQSSRKVRVRPATPLARGDAAAVRITYAGTTGRPIDDTDSLFGWVSTPEGALVVSEAYGAPTWYPVNDSPADKATYSFAITVPKDREAVANGVPVGDPVTAKGWRTFRYRETSPMASYLATVAIGDYTVVHFTKRGLRYVTAYDDGLAAAKQAESLAAISKQPAMIAYYSKLFGAYPFTSAGAIVDRFEIGYDLETQTRPIFSTGASESTVAHHTAHQWFGDSVTPRRWKDIWLNESFATYGEWLWERHEGRTTIAAQVARLRALPATDDLWDGKVGDPKAPTLYDPLVYDRGALALALLQQKVGLPTFLRILRTWATDHRYGNASTKDFIALSERISKQDLGAFFHTWLYTTGKPTF